MNSTNDTNARIVLQALKEMFVDRDVSALDRHFVKSGYKQHNPGIPNGTEALRGLIPNLGVGWGPKPMVAVDIFRLEDGKLAEHWDVMQEEVPTEQSRNGNPMFTPAPSAAR